MAGSEHAQPNAQGTKCCTKHEKKHPLEYANSFLLFLALLATAAAAVFTGKQWLTADDTEKRSLRAYIAVSDIEFGQAASSENKRFFDWFVTPSLENSGNTPALRAIFTTENAIVGGPGGTSLIFSVPGVVFPDATGDPVQLIEERIKHGMLLHERIIGPHNKIEISGGAFLLANVQSDTAHTYISGVVRYGDVFDPTPNHITKWCFRIGTNFSASGELRPAAFPCSHWNCADDQCEDDRRSYYIELRAAFTAAGKAPPAALEAIFRGID